MTRTWDIFIFDAGKVLATGSIRAGLVYILKLSNVPRPVGPRPFGS